MFNFSFYKSRQYSKADVSQNSSNQVIFNCYQPGRSHCKIKKEIIKEIKKNKRRKEIKLKLLGIFPHQCYEILFSSATREDFCWLENVWVFSLPLYNPSFLLLKT